MFQSFFEFSVSSTRSHAHKLYTVSRDDVNGVRTHFFTNRVLNVRNSLPESVTFSNAFKRSVRTVDFNKVLKCNSN